jgi:predicted flap endonuclease-1-like 5' DNA nuclease
MTWLIGQMWILLGAAFALGLAAGALLFGARTRSATAEDAPMPGGAQAVARAQAPALLFDAPSGEKDDLTMIIGVDGETELRLNDLGVFHFRQIAGWDAGAARWIEMRLNEPGRVIRERWSEQAAVLQA